MLMTYFTSKIGAKDNVYAKDWIANGFLTLNDKSVQKICLRFILTFTSNLTSIVFIWIDNKNICHLV